MAHPSPVSVSANVDTFMRSANKAAMRVNVGLPVVASTKRIHVESWGNNTTGDGTEANPYLTAQKAFDIAVALAAPCVIVLGVGSFGNVNCSASGWPSTISVQGKGPSVSKIVDVVSSGQNIAISGDHSVSFGTISSNGVAGTTGAAGASGEPPASGDNGGDGGAAGSISLSGVYAVQVSATGGNGGDGGAGGSAEALDGGNGGTGGNGGSGGSVTLNNCAVSNVYALGGGPGNGGSGGSSNTGNPGSSGSSGSPGGDASVFLDNCRVTTSYSYDASYSRVTYEILPTTSGLFNDLGANAVASFSSFWL